MKYDKNATRIIRSVVGKGYDAQGGFGQYLQLSRNKGIKMLDRQQFTTIKELKDSAVYKDAKEEANTLKLLRERGSRITPKVYRATIVKDKSGNYRAAIVMQHLSGPRLDDWKFRDIDKDFLKERLRNKIAKYGVIHDDLFRHNKNVIQHKGKWYVIDFSAQETGYIIKWKNKAA